MKLYIVSAEGGTPQELPTGEHPASYPNWSADGNSILFVDAYFGEAGAFISSVKSLDLTTKQISSLPGSEGILFLTGSTDGGYLAAIPVDAHKLMLFDMAKQSWRELAKTDVGSANWSANGKYLDFDSGIGKDQAIFRVRIADGKLEKTVSLKEFRRATASTGRPWSGLAPDDSPLLMRNVGSHEIYALDVNFP